MIESLSELWQFQFMRHALLTGLLVSIACGIIGTYVVVKRIVFLSGGISHTAFGGIGIGYFFGFNPIIGAIVFSIAAALGIAIVRQKASQREDTLIGIMWAAGMAIGIIFIDKTPGYAPNLMSYLFGNILTVSSPDLVMMIILDVIILSTVLVLFKEFKAFTFDEEYSAVSGIPITALNIILFCLIALTVVILIRAVGIILVIALLTIPPAAVIRYNFTLGKTMVFSIIIGVIFTTAGLLLSAAYNITSGAAIIIVACIGYFISLLIKPYVINHRGAKTDS
ncbi:MAG: metal ABC transporter permease [candidate division Zixibacteria bacterium]|nr:metal ABC transporter permease [candidate division Zixibacteria bacterium]